MISVGKRKSRNWVVGGCYIQAQREEIVFVDNNNWYLVNGKRVVFQFPADMSWLHRSVEWACVDPPYHALNLWSSSSELCPLPLHMSQSYYSKFKHQIKRKIIN